MLVQSNKIITGVNNPKAVLLITLIFLLIFFLTTGLTTGFGNNFLSFGPTNDEITGKPSMFMGIKLDSWPLVGLVYVIIFVSAILQLYYFNVFTSLQVYVWNPAVKYVPYSKFWTYLVLLANPVIKIILFIIQFYATATIQLQYIIPQIIAGCLINIPFSLKWLNGKKFIN